MAFKKGISGNPAGRPRGSKDKKNERLREWVMGIVDNRREMISSDLDLVDPATRLNFIAKILPYIMPKLQSVQADINMGDAHNNDIVETLRKLAEEYE